MELTSHGLFSLNCQYEMLNCTSNWLSHVFLVYRNTYFLPLPQKYLQLTHHQQHSICCSEKNILFSKLCDLNTSMGNSDIAIIYSSSKPRARRTLLKDLIWLIYELTLLHQKKKNFIIVFTARRVHFVSEDHKARSLKRSRDVSSDPEFRIFNLLHCRSNQIIIRNYYEHWRET